MKILAKLLGVGLMMILVVNLYRYFFMTGNGLFVDNYKFVGFRSFFEYVSTFEGWSAFSKTADMILSSGSNIGMQDNFWEEIVNFFRIIGCVLVSPFMIFYDAIQIVAWFIGLLTGLGFSA